MNSEKATIVREISGWLNQSPFMILVDYQGLTVTGFNELRNRLSNVGSQCHVVKNSLLRLASREIGSPECADFLHGQTAIVFGEEDVCGAAKVLKTFAKEFKKPEIRGGVLDKEQLSAEQILALAELPSKDVLRAQLLGVLLAPASKLVRTLNEPGASLARLLEAYREKMAA
ncbi:MAG: 50S ribosomal protein L10 [Verrucomicrobiales bacterium]